MLQSVELWALLLTKLTKLPCEQPHGGQHWLDKLELIWGLRCAFLLSLPKQQIPVLFCPKLSKQKSYVATLPGPFTLWFVLTKNLIEGGSAEDLLVGISTQGSGVGQGMAHLNYSISLLKWWGWIIPLCFASPLAQTLLGEQWHVPEWSFEAPEVLFF